MENEINKESQVKTVATRRIGTFTFGLVLILLGISIVIQTFFPFELLRYVLILWPLVFVSIGCETLYYLNKKDIKIKYDILSMFIVLILITFGTIFSMGNYVVNKVFYDKGVQEAFSDVIIRNKFCYDFNKTLNIKNQSGKTLTLTILEEHGDNTDVTDHTSSTVAYINGKMKEDIEDSSHIVIIEALSSWIQSSVIKTGNTIIISNLPDYIDSVNIVVYTTDTENITYDSNCTIIK